MHQRGLNCFISANQGMIRYVGLEYSENELQKAIPARTDFILLACTYETVIPVKKGRTNLL